MTLWKGPVEKSATCVIGQNYGVWRRKKIIKNYCLLFYVRIHDLQFRKQWRNQLRYTLPAGNLGVSKNFFNNTCILNSTFGTKNSFLNRSFFHTVQRPVLESVFDDKKCGFRQLLQNILFQNFFHNKMVVREKKKKNHFIINKRKKFLTTLWSEPATVASVGGAAQWVTLPPLDPKSRVQIWGGAGNCFNLFFFFF